MYSSSKEHIRSILKKDIRYTDNMTFIVFNKLDFSISMYPYLYEL